MREPRIRPLTSATVTVNGRHRGARSIIWAGLMWQDAELGEGGLRVPFCHPDDRLPPHDRAICGVRPRSNGFWFERARNGLWILKEKTAP